MLANRLGRILVRRRFVSRLRFSFSQPFLMRRVLTVVPESPVAGFAAGEYQRPHRSRFNELHNVLMRRWPKVRRSARTTVSGPSGVFSR